jgi:hypothetical protein
LFDRCAIMPDETPATLKKAGHPTEFIGQPFLKVDLKGRRFMNESVPYDFVIHRALSLPGQCYCVLFDSGYPEDTKRFELAGCSRMHPFNNGAPCSRPLAENEVLLEGMVKEGRFVRADTIGELAKGLGLPMDKMFVNLDKYGNTSAASIPVALAEAVNEGRVKVGDNVTIVAFGAGFTSGAVTIEWTADPARGIAGDAAVRPEDVRVRPPVDWDSVDPIPDALAELMRRPGPVDVPLDDVVPGEPEPAQREVHA